MKLNFQAMKRLFTLLALIPMFALAIACGEDPATNNNGDNSDEGDKPNTEGDNIEKYEDIKVVNGKVRFYLSEKEDATRTITGLSARDWAKSSVIMNGKTYAVALTDEKTSRPYVEVDEANSYNASLITSTSQRHVSRIVCREVLDTPNMGSRRIRSSLSLIAFVSITERILSI